MAQPQFFVDHKRGEVNELKTILRNPKINKDPDKKREVIKKVIAYMTLGIDVSRIFSEMIMAASTKDLVQKKMVYHYLCAYAKQKSDLAVLAINTLQKDCRDDNAMVRGLALRSLSSLGLENLSEYAMLPIRKGLKDNSPYVRKTAVIACAKLYLLSPEIVKEEFVDILYDMLRDKDAQVITNSICALNEILASEGKMVINTQIVNHLLNRIRDFGEWGQCIVLDYVSRYTPANRDEMFDIMNLLEDRLKHSNSAVVMATTKIFLNFTRDIPTVHEQVYKRLKAPLLTLMSGNVELAFTVLSHIKILADRAPGVIGPSFKHFFCRYNDPNCVKKLKLEVLTLLANQENMSDILNELAEYVIDVDIEIARASVKGIGAIAIKIDEAADEAIEHLLSFLDLNTDYVSAEAVIVIKDLLRKYPERYEEVVPALQKRLSTIDETEGKVAVIWMIGEYGDTMADAPYILEPLIDNFEEEQSHQVRMELLTATMKLFFKRPPEMQAMLGKLLKYAVEDVSKVDVRDRALLYYRLLVHDVHEAARIVNCPKVIVKTFVEVQDQEFKDKIFAEFNSLSVIYNTPEERFIKYKNEEEEEEEEEDVDEKGRDEPEEPPPVQAPTSQSQVKEDPPKVTKQEQSSFDILGTNGGSGSPSDSKEQSSSSSSSVSLVSSPQLAPDKYQGFWGSLPVAHEDELQLADVKYAQQIEKQLQANNIYTMASGTVETTMRFYFFAQDTAGCWYLWETRVDLTRGQLFARMKSTAQAGGVNAVVNIFTNVMKPMLASGT